MQIVGLDRSDQTVPRPWSIAELGRRIGGVGRWLKRWLLCLVVPELMAEPAPPAASEHADTAAARQAHLVAAWQHEFDCHLCIKLRKALLVALVLLVGDPFGWQGATLAASRLVHDRLVAVTERPTEAERIAVVLLDEATMGELHTRWPPALPAWTRLLDRIIKAQPASVFVDVVLAEQRGSDDDLDDLVEVIRGGPGPDGEVRGVPVVLADSARAAATQHPEWMTGCAQQVPQRPARRTAVLPRLACATAATAMIEWPLNQKDARAYPLAACLGRLDEAGCQPLAGPPVPQLAPPPVETRLPATVLAELACGAKPQLRPAWCSDGLAWLDQQALLQSGAAVIPRWPLTAPALRNLGDHAALATDCTVYVTGGAGWPAWAIQAAILANTLGLPAGAINALGALAGPADADRQPLLPDFTAAATGATARRQEPCLPFPVISAAALLTDDRELTGAAVELLRDRTVLIGDGTIASPDRVAAPLHVTLPGVVLHAVALQTLLRHGPEFPRAGKKGLLGVERGKWADYVYKGLTFVLAVCLVRLKERLVRHRADLAGSGPAMARYAQRLKWAFRGLVLLAALGMLVLGAAFDPLHGYLTPANPLLVFLIALGIALPLLEVMPLKDPSPTEHHHGPPHSAA